MKAPHFFKAYSRLGVINPPLGSQYPNLGVERASNPVEVGYVHLDSHADCNTFTESPTKNFHGMFLRPLIDGFDLPSINEIVKVKMPTENIVLIGNLELDLEESRFFKGATIKNITRVDLVTNHSQSLKWLNEFRGRFKHLHISLDIDVFDRTVAMATGTPSTSGCFPEEIFPILELLSGHPSWSMDLVEVNPDKEQDPHTVSLAQQVLRRMFR